MGALNKKGPPGSSNLQMIRMKSPTEWVAQLKQDCLLLRDCFAMLDCDLLGGIIVMWRKENSILYSVFIVIPQRTACCAFWVDIGTRKFKSWAGCFRFQIQWDLWSPPLSGTVQFHELKDFVRYCEQLLCLAEDIYGVKNKFKKEKQKH